MDVINETKVIYIEKDSTEQVLRQLKGLETTLINIHNYRKTSVAGVWAKQYLKDMAPYCTGHGYVVNREYKPLGVSRFDEFVDYKKWPCWVPKLQHDEDRSIAWLYNDSTAPWLNVKCFKRYLDKLQELIARIEA